MLTKQEIKNKLKGTFSFDPTPDQEVFFSVFSDFLLCRQQPKAFLLRGFAGTGKTTLVTAITSFVEANGYQTLLMAPTGRAAKVMSGYSGKNAYTIHRSIYARKPNAQGQTIITLAPNLFQHAFFIVDEAGMIGSGPSVWPGSGKPRYLLDDLLEYTAMGTNCHLILCGDTAQLPPVGETFSAALSDDHLKKNYYLELFGTELKNVVRQAENSGILKNATRLRENLVTGEEYKPIGGDSDFRLLTGYEFTDEIEKAYSQYGHEGVCIVTRSNKRANQYNQQVRNRLLYRENALDAGDMMM
ncbi:MAG: ATP-dependent RecD-like DNA helicase, partial [Flavobacteriales bacterium]